MNPYKCKKAKSYFDNNWMDVVKIGMDFIKLIRL